MLSDTLVDASAQSLRCHPDLDRSGAGAPLHDHATYVALAQLFGALSDPTRAKILHLLLDGEWCTCDLATVVGISESSVSQHLRVLRSLRVVRSRRAGKFVYYQLDDEHVALLIQMGLTHQGHGMKKADGDESPASGEVVR
jgi:DNA-binding transcriptional ArsR family regulator